MSVSYVLGVIDGEVNDESMIPEKRLLACILQRALVDILTIQNRVTYQEEVETGAYDEDDSRCSTFGTGPRTRDTRKGTGNKAWKSPREVRNLLRWFKSDGTDPFSFKYILMVLNIQGLESKILEIVDNGNIKDHPNLSKFI